MIFKDLEEFIDALCYYTHGNEDVTVILPYHTYSEVIEDLRLSASTKGFMCVDESKSEETIIITTIRTPRGRIIHLLCGNEFSIKLIDNDLY